jgi:mono/diheme cytochrome c family protein
MKRLLVALLLVVVAATAALVALNLRDEDPVHDIDAAAADPAADAALVERGRYLALAGNCAGCHTARGGADYAGGVGIETPFGTVFASNLTPDRETGIGTWSASHFWRAMHNGRSRDGRLLYPVFPYPNYTHVSREDSDAIHAWLRTLPPVTRPNTAHTLRFPFDTQVALAAWRALFFQPGIQEPDPGRSAQWNRGAYLVNGLGHCNACHSGRNLFGATTGTLDLSGGLIPMQNWYAPSLSAPDEAGVAHWQTGDVTKLLATGVSPRGSVLGPMAEVVFRSTQYLLQADLEAIAVFLKALPQTAARDGEPAASPTGPLAATLAQGARVYEDQCAQCHGKEGQGVPGAYPPLAGNRAVLMDPPANLVRIVLGGGFAPATAGNPRPFGMPPYATSLSDREIAAVLTTIRNSWGNGATPVTTADIHRYREGSAPGR